MGGRRRDRGRAGLATLGTGIERPRRRRRPPSRANAASTASRSASAAAFADHLRVVWLVPAMDALFAGAPSERRRFLDRLALAVDAEHAQPRQRAGARRCVRATGCWRSRGPMRIGSMPSSTRPPNLRSRSPDCASKQCAGSMPCWRSRKDSAFPPAEIALDGWMEKLIPSHPAVEIEERYRAVLRDNRARDAAAGPHARRPASDRSQGQSMPQKGIAAADASTGEQKALLIGLVLAHARLIAEMTGFAPVLLLDEVVAHLDPARRAALHEELAQLGAQVWMTGADPALFAEIGDDAAMVEVSSGRLATESSANTELCSAEHGSVNCAEFAAMRPGNPEPECARSLLS